MFKQRSPFWCDHGVLIGLTGSASLMAADEMRVRDLPVPEGAAEITFYEAARGMFRFQVRSDFKTTGGFYSARLAGAKMDQIRQRQPTAQLLGTEVFRRVNVSLEVRVDSRPGGSEVRLTPNGMMWEEDDQPQSQRPSPYRGCHRN
jgi:hypothetical protein